MRIKSNIIVTLLSAFVTMAILFSGYTIFAKDSGTSRGSYCPSGAKFEDLSSYVSDSTKISKLRDYRFFCVQELYQKTIDSLFSAKMKGLVAMLKDTKDPATAITDDVTLKENSLLANPFLAGGIDPTAEAMSEKANAEEKDAQKKMNGIAASKRKIILDKCQPTGNKFYADLKISKKNDIKTKAGNLSTYCVAMEAAYVYEDYEKILYGKLAAPILEDVIDEILKEREEELNRPLTEEEAKAEEEYNASLSSALIAAVKRFNTRVSDELNQSQEVLKATVGVYDEFKNAYPVHKVYRQIITDLVKYKNMLRDVRMNMVLLPAKFINLTSASCP